jgi:hypothetical protein
VSRSSTLLIAAADALERGEDPLALHFLNEHDVEAGECLDLADSLAIGARLLAWVMENPKQAATFARTGLNGMHLEMVTDALAKALSKQSGR